MNIKTHLQESCNFLHTTSSGNTYTVRETSFDRTLHLTLHGSYIEFWLEQRYDYLQSLVFEIFESYRRSGSIMRVCPDDLIAVLYDETQNVLIAGRDRLGVLPLYWTEDIDGIHVSTSARLLVEQGYASSTMNSQSLDDFLTLQYTPGTSTLWRDVQKLSPAHELRWQRGHAPQTSRYWNLQFGQGHTASPNEWKAGLEILLDERFGNLPLPSYEQSLAMISGGIDTSTNIDFLVRHGHSPAGLTVVFKEEEFNEGEIATLVAAQYGISHKQFTYSQSDLLLLPEMSALFDEPNGDQAALATYAALRSNQGFDSLYSGEGGDEVFGLPRRFPVDRMRDSALDLQMLAKDYMHSLEYLSVEMRTSLYKASTISNLDTGHTAQVFKKLFEEVKSQSVLPKLIHAQLNTWLAENVVAKDRQAGSAFGMDVRFPLLGHKLISFVTSVPESELFTVLNNKALVRQVLKERLPEQVLHKKKHTFMIPMKQWFDKPDVLLGQFTPLLREDHPIWSLLERRRVAELVEVHRSGRQNLSLPLWQILAFATWLAESPVTIKE